MISSPPSPRSTTEKQFAPRKIEKIKAVASKKLNGKATVAISIGDEPYSSSIAPTQKDRVVTPVGSPLNNRYVFDNFVGGKVTS